jgi:hypothetical protein
MTSPTVTEVRNGLLHSPPTVVTGAAEDNYMRVGED